MQKRLAELVREAKEKHIYSDEIAQYLIDRGVVVPVMCKDCKDYRQNPYNQKEEELLCMCYCDWIATEPDDFCSHGERKERE